MERPPTSSSRLKREVNETAWPIFSPTNSTEADEISKKIEEKLIKQLSEQSKESKYFDLADVAPFLTEGAEALVEDEFTKCFTSPENESWNWNVYLYPAWIFGVFIRYCILFPMRLTCLLVGTFLFAVSFVFVSSFIKQEDLKQKYQRKCISFYCSVFVMSWSGVIKYHGVEPPRKKNQIFVANHTTVMDVVILQQHSSYAVVGQKHVGLMGFIQTYLLKCIGCLWFNRSEAKDRLAVARMIKEHIQNDKNTPLLVFPEGVCVNNEYCVMFKKGAFELGAVVYPIAIKYNTLFVDAFWNSRKQSFVRHMFNLMTSWAVVCDVWYMEPQTIRPNESPSQFANRVKAMIAKKAGLINVHWDGYLKYFRPSPRFVETKQRVFAQSLVARYTNRQNDDVTPSSSAANSPAQSPAPTRAASELPDGPSPVVHENGMNVVPPSEKGKAVPVVVVQENGKVDHSKMNGSSTHQRKAKMDASELDR